MYICTLEDNNEEARASYMPVVLKILHLLPIKNTPTEMVFPIP